MKKKDISSTSSFDHLPSISFHDSPHEKQALFTHKGSSTSITSSEASSIKNQQLSSSTHSSFSSHSTKSEDSDFYRSLKQDFVEDTPPSHARKKIMTARNFSAGDFLERGMKKIDSKNNLLSEEEESTYRSSQTTLPSLSSKSRESDDSASFSSEPVASLSSFSSGGFAITQEDLRATGMVLGTPYEPSHTTRGKVKKIRDTFLQCVQEDPSISTTSAFKKKKEKITKALEKILLEKIKEQKQKEKPFSPLLPPLH